MTYFVNTVFLKLVLRYLLLHISCNKTFQHYPYNTHISLCIISLLKIKSLLIHDFYFKIILGD